MAITTATLLKASAFSSGQFGVVPETGLTNTILQDIGFEASGKEITPATNEVGAEIGTGVMGGNISNFTGTFLQNGTFSIAIAATLALINKFGITDPILLVTYGLKLNHENWATGDFKAISLAGGSVTTTT